MPYDLWLDSGVTDVSAASDLLRPFDARQMRRYPISPRIILVYGDEAQIPAVSLDGTDISPMPSRSSTP